MRATFRYVPETGRLIRKARGLGARVGVEIGYIHAGGYRRAHALGGQVMTAHLVWIWHHGSAPTGILTHVNGDPADDRIENLAVRARPINVIASDAGILNSRQRPERRAAGIYEIVQIGTDRRYVGSATDLAQRWRQHLAHLERGKHHSVALQRAWNKHGPEAFGFRTLIRCDRRHLVFYEQRAIDVLRPKLNCAPKAGSQLGYTHTAQTIGKMRAAAVGRPSSFKGRKHTAESRMRISENRRGKSSGPFTAERRRKIGESQRGKPKSAETRAKIAATLSGRSTGRGLLSHEKVRLIRRLRNEGLGRMEISRQIGVHRNQVNTVLGNHGYTWVI